MGDEMVAERDSGVEPWAARLLRVLDERGGYPAGTIRQQFPDGTYGPNPVTATTVVKNSLLRMEAMGLVRRLDDQKPILWLRTPAGTAALAEPQS